jgi:hypothetical protein
MGGAGSRFVSQVIGRSDGLPIGAARRGEPVILGES